MDWAWVVKPEIAIVSAVLSPAHGHPHEDLRARLEETLFLHSLRWWTGKDSGTAFSDYDEAIYSTATNGTIEISTNGAEYEVDYSPD